MTGPSSRTLATHRTALLAALTTLVGASSAGAASWASYQLLMEQATKTRRVIGRDTRKPPHADGIYTAGCVAPEPVHRSAPADVHLMIFGDSTAAGLGCVSAAEVPGVLLARGLAEETDKRIRLSTKAIVGATSKGLKGQVDAMFIAGPPPDAAVILVGANDVTRKHGVRNSALRLGDAVGRLSSSGAVVVVGTCPDLGIVAPIPQPLRTVVRQWGLHLARAQAAATRSNGGHPVPLADLLAPEFLAAPDRMFSPDQFHPSAAGYELAANQLLPVLCSALNMWVGGPVPEQPNRSAAVDSRRLAARLTESLNRFLRRREAERHPDANPFGQNPAARLLARAEAVEPRAQLTTT